MNMRRIWRPKVVGYMEAVVSQLNNTDFNRLFHIPIEVSDLLTDLVKRDASTNMARQGRLHIDAYKQVLIFLHHMCSQATNF